MGRSSQVCSSNWWLLRVSTVTKQKKHGDAGDIRVDITRISDDKALGVVPFWYSLSSLCKKNGGSWLDICCFNDCLHRKNVLEASLLNLLLQTNGSWHMAFLQSVPLSTTHHSKSWCICIASSPQMDKLMIPVKGQLFFQFNRLLVAYSGKSLQTPSPHKHMNETWGDEEIVPVFRQAPFCDLLIHCRIQSRCGQCLLHWFMLDAYIMDVCT